MTKTGYAFVDCPELPDDVRVDMDALGGAFHGDTVRIVWNLGKDRRYRGRVTGIVSRGREELVGTLEADQGRHFVVPDDQRFHADVLLTHEGVGQASPGDKVLVRIERWGGPNESPLGAVSRVLGRSGEHETETAAIVMSHGFDLSYPPDAQEEAARICENERMIRESELSERRDFREIPTVTIDPFDAKDFDDALSYQELQDGQVEVGVHIADVSHYVRPGTALDAEALRRGTSVYLPDRTVPMLPHELSDDLCSLTPGTEKRTISAVFVFDRSGSVVSRWFGPTLIRSAKRFTYEEAQTVLDGAESPFSSMLLALNKGAERMRAERERKGAIDFDTGEVKVLVENGKLVGIRRKERLAAHRLVEEWMLFANRSVAELIGERQKGKKSERFLYRIHDTPDPEKLEHLSNVLRALGKVLRFDEDGSVSQSELQRALLSVKDLPGGKAARVAALRAMAKAIYATENRGHFGLAFAHYTHFTSPIRRYPDLIVHRVLRGIAAKTAPDEKAMEAYDSIARHSTEREIEAAEAERESVKRYQAEYMSERIGQTFDGIVSGVLEWGIFVEEATTGSEGLVETISLPGGPWNFEESRYRLVNPSTGVSYAIGDSVRIKVAGADPASGTIDYVFEESSSS